MILTTNNTATTITKIFTNNTQYKTAVVLIAINNPNDADTNADIYICENGKTPNNNPETLIFKNLLIAKNDTILLNTEKILLGQNDSIYIDCVNTLNILISYELY